MLSARGSGLRAWYEPAAALVVAASLAACGDVTDEPATEAPPTIEAPPPLEAAPANEPDATADATLEALPSLEEVITRQTQCEYQCESNHKNCLLGAAALRAPTPTHEPGAPLPACSPFCEDAAADPASDRPSSTCETRRDVCLQQCADSASR